LRVRMKRYATVAEMLTVPATGSRSGTGRQTRA
jgi:hypothetical protein